MLSIALELITRPIRIFQRAVCLFFPSPHLLCFPAFPLLPSVLSPPSLVPESYGALDSGLWLLQYDVPSFNDISNTPFPNMIVSLTDSSGLMSNSSIVQQVISSDSTCDVMTGDNTFVFYINDAPVEVSRCERKSEDFFCDQL